MPTPVNESESYLSALGQRTFLQPWTYSNLFNDRGGGKELCDMLVVFGGDVLVFSDKHCELKASEDSDLAWKRWYRKAVLASARQIQGAVRWIETHPNRIFTDAAATTHLELPLPDKPLFHRILTVRGAASTARSTVGGRGSLLRTNSRLADCVDKPLQLGSFDVDGTFYHIIDEIALDAIFETLDTAPDFVRYLRQREKFFRREQTIVAASEEDLLGLYMMSFDDEARELAFPTFDSEGPSEVFVDDSHWDGWQSSPQRKARDTANKESYGWDALTSKFAYHTLTGTQEYATSALLAEQEPLLRWMAGLSRLERRVMIRNLHEMVISTQPGQVRRRYFPPGNPVQAFWVFLVLPSPAFPHEYEHYRSVRRGLLEMHLLVIKYLHPEAQDIVGVAVGEWQGAVTEDAMYLDASELPEELIAEGKNGHETLGIFSKATRSSSRDWDYPLPDAD